MKKNDPNCFIYAESGAMTALGLTIGVACIVVGGLAIDVANAMMMRTQMQVAADAVAHAAIYYRETNTANQAKTVALDLADVNMPHSKFGPLITANDISFGVWDADAQEFHADPGSKTAVMVNLARVEERSNSVGTYFLKFAGIGFWNVRRAAVFEAYFPTCFEEGIVGDEVVDIQSNNQFLNGFCVHSNDHVELNNGVEFQTGTVLSMPDRRDLVEPTAANNTGVDEALRDGVYRMRLITMLPDIIAGLENLDPTWLPDYITDYSVKTLPRNASMSDFEAGKVHVINCVGGQRINFSSGILFENLILVTNCQIHFASDAQLINAVIATTHTGSNSINSAAKMTIGRDDGCAADGGAQMLSLGSIDFSAGLEMFGGQIVAVDDISFSANANGIEGASIVAGGTASGTSNMAMGFCGSGMERNFAAEYFRLAI
ncbi:MAG: pilus assembly protein TadG-related protein [Paracoccaceae bacterium]